ncbi:hypothetical protein [Nostoc sp.]|uniref:hypothetical protein n=1 Tax=Nostoc sp. TaxID=1180 RepID=UPI002FF978B7
MLYLVLQDSKTSNRGVIPFRLVISLTPPVRSLPPLASLPNIHPYTQHISPTLSANEPSPLRSFLLLLQAFLSCGK